ncbi:MAG: hypothetical protein AAFZ15_32460 [Bacteroidota bacterium]
MNKYIINIVFLAASMLLTCQVAFSQDDHLAHIESIIGDDLESWYAVPAPTNRYYNTLASNPNKYHKGFKSLLAKYLAEADIRKIGRLTLLAREVDHRFFAKELIDGNLIWTLQEKFVTQYSEDRMLDFFAELIEMDKSKNRFDDRRKNEYKARYLNVVRILQDRVVHALRKEKICDLEASRYCLSKLADKANVSQFGKYMYYLGESCNDNEEVKTKLKEVLTSVSYHNISSLKDLYESLFRS